MSTRHRSGWLKQSNKSHKNGHRSKREMDKGNGGRVSGARAPSIVSSGGSRALAQIGRQARANQAVLLRKSKRQAMLHSRRQGGSSVGGSIGGAPRTLGIVYLCEAARVPAVLGAAAERLAPGTESFTTVFPGDKFRTNVLVADRSNLSVLDVAKVADVLCFVLPLSAGAGKTHAGKGGALGAFLEDAVDEKGRDFITITKAQGLPAVVGVLQNLELTPTKHRSALRKQAANFFVEEFGDGTKMVVDESVPAKQNTMTDAPEAVFGGERADLSTEQLHFLRAIMETRLKNVTWRSERSYMLASESELQPAADGKATLVVTGYLRGRPLSANQLVHIPGQGTFKMARIERAKDPHPVSTRRGKGGESQSPSVLAVADPAKQPSLDEEAVPNMLAGEQTWPTAEEMGDGEAEAEAEAEEKATKKKRSKLPKGTSDYQATWLMGISDDEDENSEEGENGGGDDDDDDDDQVEDEGPAGMTLEEWKKKQREERDEVEFPDEVETPLEISAKDRFAKYRGLKSFRSSPWHPKESLPREYARIFQLDNPVGLQNQVLAEGRRLEDAWLATEGGRSSKAAGANGGMEVEAVTEGTLPGGFVCPGQYVSLHIEGVPATILDELRAAKLPLVVGALLDNEAKLSVLNCGINKASTFEAPVKSREPLLMSCGIWRREVRPAFSENTANCDKHKFERFLHAGRWSVATVYAPITFGTNVPTLFLQPGTNALVASGTLQSLDPDRIVLKKVVLSGYPLRVKKSWAVVRFMFFRPEDVRWFKPVDLWTKYGMSGRILEPVGTHGLFKCSFNKPIKNNDTVCMSLYKRVFPKPVHEFAALRAEEEENNGNGAAAMTN